MKNWNIIRAEKEFNKAFADEVFMPMVKLAVTLMFVAVIVDYGFQLIEAINVITNAG